MDPYDVVLAALSLPAEVQDQTLIVTFPRFGPMDFNRHGMLKLFELGKTFEAGRNLALRRYNIGTMAHHLKTGNTVYLRQTEYTELGDLSRSSVLSTKSPTMKMTVRPTFCGNSSFGLEQVLYDGDGRDLVRLDVLAVFVDESSRRPAPLPPDTRASFLPTARPGGRYVPPDPPATGYPYRLDVEPADTDRNQHTNHAVYLRYCWDAAMGAIQAGYFGTAEGRQLNFRVKTVTAVYESESVEGDSLVVWLWTDGPSGRCIYFSIESEDKFIFHCRWTLH